MYVWPAMYLSLGLLVYVLPPGSMETRSGIRQWMRAHVTSMIGAFFILWPIYRWTTWIRNIFFLDVGRRTVCRE